MSNAGGAVAGFGESAGALTASSSGVDISGTSYVQLVAATAFEWEAMHVSLLNTGAAPVTNRIITIGIGAGGSERDLVSGLLLTSSGSDTRAISLSTVLPVRVPKGSRLAGKCSAAAGGTFQMALTGIAKGPFGDIGCTEGIGYGISTSQGTAIDCGGSINTKGGWTQITAATTRHIRYLMAMISNNNNTALTDAGYLMDIGIGASSSETAIFPNLLFQGTSSFDTMNPSVFGPFPCDIPAGSRLAVRGQSSINNASDRVFDIVLIGFS